MFAIGTKVRVVPNFYDWGHYTIKPGDGGVVVGYRMYEEDEDEWEEDQYTLLVFFPQYPECSGDYDYQNMCHHPNGYLYVDSHHLVPLPKTVLEKVAEMEKRFNARRQAVL